MTEPDDIQSVDSSAAAAQGDKAGLAPNGLKRRRLFKLGASTATVALTLTSRPARAWHCNSTSAWGSAQLAPTASTTARNGAHQTDDECWSISEWCNNTSHPGIGQPWAALGLTKQKDINAYSCASLYAKSGGMCTGLKSTDSVLAKLQGGTQFQQYMLCARLNANLRSTVAACLKTNAADQLPLMASGSYSPPNLPHVTWNQAEIIQYLSSNWMVQP